MAVVLVFFYWPAAQAVVQATLRQDPFGLHSQFVWFENFSRVLTNPFYLGSLRVTLVFAVAVIALAMSVGLVLAIHADRQVRGGSIYKALMIWPFASAPAVQAPVWLLSFIPPTG